ncbi:hypothetical protein BG015_009336 [Linnemannia schmuckeri]|uniref:Transmembrane protein n=1 Tax=Linnemannia schmuckeri TaxID=64567 RepID=A0A9P5S7F7_9FUNG|nr:hypothetical protein BG015_009336 [Linnemannia schmuckeri]
MSVPLYTYPCLTSTASGDILLLGISPAAEGTLNVHKLDLSNLDSPVATLYATQTFTEEWTSKGPTACFPYSGNAASIAFFAQFGSLSRFTNVRATSSIEPPIYYREVAFVSPKLFSFAGASGNFDFFHVYTNKTFPGTGSSWSGARFNATDSLYSFHSYFTSQYPSALPSVSVGTFSPGGTSGYSIVFDKAGAGMIFSTQLNQNSVLGDPNGSLITLAKTQDVDMSGIKLTDAAIPVTMNNVGYFLDKASDGTTIVYSINPSQSPKLQALSITSDVPIFSTVQSAAAVGSKIVIYSTSNTSAVFFNSLDTSAGTWTGPNLIRAAKPPGNNGGGDDGGSKVPLGAIIGGVVGGLVVIALIVFFVTRKRCNGYKPAAVSPPTNNTYQDPSKLENATTPPTAPPTQQVYPNEQQQQAYYQHQNQHQHLPPTSHYHMSQHNPTVYHTQQQQQQPYTYTPPTLFSQEQHLTAAPIIFQPQSTSGSSPTYTQAAYSPSTTAVSEYPQTPVTPTSQVAYSTPESQHLQTLHHVPPVPFIPNKPSNPQYFAPELTSTAISETMEPEVKSVVQPPSNPQFVPQSGSDYAQ